MPDFLKLISSHPILCVCYFEIPPPFPIFENIFLPPNINPYPSWLNPVNAARSLRASDGLIISPITDMFYVH